MDIDKDETLCASVTGRDNIPRVGKKKPSDRRTETHVLLDSKDERLKDLAGLASRGQLGSDAGSVLWLEERWCRGGHTAKRGGAAF